MKQQKMNNSNIFITKVAAKLRGIKENEQLILVRLIEDEIVNLYPEMDSSDAQDWAVDITESDDDQGVKECLRKMSAWNVEKEGEPIFEEEGKEIVFENAKVLVFDVDVIEERIQNAALMIHAIEEDTIDGIIQDVEDNLSSMFSDPNRIRDEIEDWALDLARNCGGDKASVSESFQRARKALEAKYVENE